MMKQTGNERGGTLLLYTVAMVGMMGMAALAIDLGFLRKARAEAQRAADAAALAGASAFQLDLAESVEVDSARTRAYRVANANYMNGVAFDSLSEVTVTIIPEEVKVRVKVRRAAVPIRLQEVSRLRLEQIGVGTVGQHHRLGQAEHPAPHLRGGDTGIARQLVEQTAQDHRIGEPHRILDRLIGCVEQFQSFGHPVPPA